MKPNAIILLTIIVAVILALIAASVLPSCGRKEIDLVSVENVPVVDGGSFSLRDYGQYLVDFSSDHRTTPPENGTAAVRAAASVWQEVYYYDALKNPQGYPLDVLAGLDSIVFRYDDQNDCWLIYGQLPSTVPPVAGGTPYMILKSDGRVLAVWHTQ